MEKYAGEHWTKYELRQSIAAIDELIKRSAKGDGLQISAANLILLLQGKVYEDFACNDIHGSISRASLAELQHAVKSRVLELTIELEKSIPEATNVSFGNQQPANSETSAKVTQISHQVVYGNVTSISSNSDTAQFHFSISPGDSESFKNYLIDGGLKESDATELSEIVASEDAGDRNEPLGKRAKFWLAENLKKATDGTWKVGISVATELIKKAALTYYGLD